MSDEPTGPTPLSPRDWEIAFSSPAVLTNRFTAVISHLGVRLSLLEIGLEGTEPQHRFSAVMSYSDALALSDLLRELVIREIENTEKEKEVGLRAGLSETRNG